MMRFVDLIFPPLDSYNIATRKYLNLARGGNLIAKNFK